MKVSSWKGLPTEVTFVLGTPDCWGMNDMLFHTASIV